MVQRARLWARGLERPAKYPVFRVISGMTRRSPKPQRQVRLLGPPLCPSARKQAETPGATGGSRPSCAVMLSRASTKWRYWAVMSQENVEIARRAYEAANHRPKPDFATVNAVIAVRARGKHSGAPAEQRLGIVMTLRDGKVARSETYPSRAEALEAVGLRE